MEDIIQNVRNIVQRIENACRASARNPDEMKLLLATKTVAAENIKVALQAGGYLIAENKVQEVREKFEALKDTTHESHFIGHLQTNKIKEILRYDIACIQSVDRLRLAEKLQQRLEFENKQMNILIQVNTSGEESKFGSDPREAVSLVNRIAQFDRLHIKGLMTIGLFSAEREKVRKCFALLRRLRDEIRSLEIPNVSMDELSMGMSGDLETAIEEGSTIVRVGTAIFGKRKYPDSYYWNESRSPA